MPHSCQQGICGQCEVRVLNGIPNHRDNVLSESERASNETIMVCCSRAFSGSLTLDL
jgi:ferredoxin